MKVAIGVLAIALAVTLAAVAALGRWQSMQSGRIAALERSVAVLSGKLEEGRNKTSLELQAKCAEQARKTFQQEGYDKRQMADYTNHYSSPISRCFVEIRNTRVYGDTTWTYRYVVDAFEGKEYGTYMWHTEKGKKYWEVPPFQCEATLPSGEKKQCHSDDEFTELVKPYMEGGR
ncbi:MAG TPA: hypothetical protein VMX54_10040 [Vicinamibacteria bacterium]|nr:hypothetical protein [Vicinamibacteria bacterium]